MPLLAEFLQLYPRIQLDIELDDNPVSLVEHEYDIGIRLGQGSSARFRDSRVSIQSCW